MCKVTGFLQGMCNSCVYFTLSHKFWLVHFYYNLFRTEIYMTSVILFMDSEKKIHMDLTKSANNSNISSMKRSPKFDNVMSRDTTLSDWRFNRGQWVNNMSSVGFN